MIKKILTLLFSLALLVACGKESKAPINQGKILFTVGKVLVNQKAAKTGTVLKTGDVIETQTGAICDILVGKKNIFRLKSNSKVIYKISKNQSVIQVEKGWLAGVIKNKKIFSQQKFAIHTPTMVAGVRGTSFCMKVEDPKNTYFCTCNGTIALKDSKGGKEHSVTAAHHTAERFTLNEAGQIVVNNKPGMHYHGDADIEALAKKINVKINWQEAAK